jgi:hypothetical protein
MKIRSISISHSITKTREEKDLTTFKRSLISPDK